MLPRYLAIAAGLLLFAGRLIYAQVDAQDRTQSFFDEHKGADVVNPDRVITNTVRRPPTAVHVSDLPPLTKASVPKVSRAVAKEIAKLRGQKEAFVTTKMKAEQSVAGAKAATLDVGKMIKKFEKHWDDTPDGHRLKRLERSATTGSTLPPLTR